MKTRPGLMLVIALLLPVGLFAADKRNIPLELFLIIDGSAAFKNAKDTAVRWLNDRMVDGILQEGDSLTIWRAAETAEVIFSETLNGPGDKARIKRVLQFLKLQEGGANFAGPIRDATARAARIRNSRSMVYTLLVSASITGGSPSLGGDAVGLLRFTRVEEFSGWRAMVIGLGLTPVVQQAATAYMQGNR